MRAAVRIAWRETRAAWKRLLPLLLCLAVGVGAIVLVGSFAASVRAAIEERTRGLLAADLQLSSSAPIDRTIFPTLASIERTGGALSPMTEFVSVVVPVGREGEESLLTEVKAVGAAYPLVGRLTFADGSTANAPRGRDVLVEQSLLARLNVATGDELKLGTETVRIAGVLGTEPDRSLAAVALGPRVLMDEALLPDTGLLDRGSRATYRLSVRLPATLRAADVKRILQTEGKGTTVSIRTAEDAQSRLREALDRLRRTLVTVALAILLLAGTGIALTIRLHVLQRLDALAILRAVGASRAQLTAVVLFQALGLGLLGSALGVAGGIGAQSIIPRLVADLLPEGFSPVISWASVAEGVALGLATTVLFALASALLASRVSPLAVLRRSPVPMLFPRKPGELVFLVGSALVFVAVLLVTVGDRRIGLGLITVLLVLVVVLQLLSRGLFALLRRAAVRAKSIVVREGLLHPTRAARAAATVVTTLTVGGLLIGTVALVERNLVTSLGTSLAQERPNVYVVGVRAEQRDAVSDAAGVPVAFEPVVRARVYAVDGRVIQRGRPAEGAEGEDRGPSGGRREYGITTRDALGPAETLVDGRFWNGTPASPEVSIEEEESGEMGAAVGSTITFDILGTRLEARVTSVRAVDWDSGRPNYVFVLSPGSLDGAPTTYFAALDLPPEDVASFQARLAEAVPNASAFDLSHALGIIEDVLAQIVAVVEFLAGLVVLVGLILLGGMVVSTRAARVRETAILRTVGAKAKQIRRMLILEYGALGLAAGLLAAALAELASWIVTTRVLDLDWSPFLGPVLLGVAVFTLVSVVVGVAAALPILRVAPLRTLREE